MDYSEMNEIAKKMIAAVDGLEEPFRSIAYRIFLERAFDHKLVGSEKKASAYGPAAKVSPAVTPSANEPLSQIIEKINRSQHPAIMSMKKVKDQALYVLKISKDEAGVDGLTSKQISDVLDQVFRIRASKEAINMALASETRYVDRKPIKVMGGQAYVYRLMAPGEAYLAEILKQGEGNET